MLLAFDRYTLDDANRELRRDAEPVKIDPQQFDLLVLFVRHPGRLLSRQQIIERVWEGRIISDSGLSVAVAKLRKVLGKPQDGREFIESRYGRGYRFLPEVALVPGPERQPTAPALDASSFAPLVGRADVLAQLRASVEHALAGRGRLCVLAGEPGIGKTRLAESVAHSVQDQGTALVVWGRCESEGAPALWPVRQIMRELTRHELVDAASSSATEAKSLELAFAAPDAEPVQLMGSLRYGGGGVDHGTLQTLAQRIVEAGRKRPLLLIVDDIQWADSASLRVLTYLADELYASSILLMCGLRCGPSTGPDQRKVARLWNHRNCQRHELQRLTLQDVTDYVCARLGKDEQSTELGRALFTRSEGNPFFMVDLWGALHPALPKSARCLRPSSLALDAVRERLEDLPQEPLHLLSAAAVIGHDFDVGLLSHMTGSAPELIPDVLDAARAHQTVVPIAGTGGAYTFVHELIREVLYGELPPQQRGQLHLLAGQGLQRRLANGGEVTSAELAHHFLSAQPHGDIETAIDYAQRAAAEASRLAAHEEARDFLLRGLDVLSFRVATRPEVRAGLLLQLAVVERIVGDPAYNAHLATAVSIGRDHGLGRLLTSAGQLLSLSPDLVAHAEAASVLDAANASLEADDYEHLAIVHAHMAWTPPNCLSARRVAELIERAQELANKTTSAKAHVVVDEARLHFSAGPDNWEQAEQIAARIENACVEYPDVASQARRVLVQRFRLITAMQRGDRVAMAQAIEARAALLSRLKNAELSWHHERMLVVKAMNEGRFQDVKTELIALRERARRLELHASELVWSLDYGVLLCQTSDVSALAPRVRPLLQASDHDSPQTRAGKIRSMLDFGLLDQAAAAIAQIPIEAIEDLPHDRDYLAVLCHLAAGAAAVGSTAHCEVLLRLLSPYSAYYAVGISFHCEGSVASHVGLLCEALGERHSARKHLAHGMEREQAFGLLPRAALTGLRLAKLMFEAGEAREALRLLQHVQEQAERMGMTPLASAARDLHAEAAGDWGSHVRRDSI